MKQGITGAARREREVQGKRDAGMGGGSRRNDRRGGAERRRSRRGKGGRRRGRRRGLRSRGKGTRGMVEGDGSRGRGRERRMRSLRRSDIRRNRLNGFRGGREGITPGKGLLGPASRRGRRRRGRGGRGNRKRGRRKGEGAFGLTGTKRRSAKGGRGKGRSDRGGGVGAQDSKGVGKRDRGSRRGRKRGAGSGARSRGGENGGNGKGHRGGRGSYRSSRRGQRGGRDRLGGAEDSTGEGAWGESEPTSLLSSLTKGEAQPETKARNLGLKLEHRAAPVADTVRATTVSTGRGGSGTSGTDMAGLSTVGAPEGRPAVHRRVAEAPAIPALTRVRPELLHTAVLPADVDVGGKLMAPEGNLGNISRETATAAGREGIALNTHGIVIFEASQEVVGTVTPGNTLHGTGRRGDGDRARAGVKGRIREDRDRGAIKRGEGEHGARLGLSLNAVETGVVRAGVE